VGPALAGLISGGRGLCRGVGAGSVAAADGGLALVGLSSAAVDRLLRRGRAGTGQICRFKVAGGLSAKPPNPN
jgi:hypothetical protein